MTLLEKRRHTGRTIISEAKRCKQENTGERFINMGRVDEKERWGRIQAGKVAQSLLSSKECNALV